MLIPEHAQNVCFVYFFFFSSFFSPPSDCGWKDWHTNKLMLIRHTLNRLVLLRSVSPFWSWWLIKSFVAPGWSAFETRPDPSRHNLFLYLKEKKRKNNHLFIYLFFNQSNFARELYIIITRADTSNILQRSFRSDEASKGDARDDDGSAGSRPFINPVFFSFLILQTTTLYLQYMIKKCKYNQDNYQYHQRKCRNAKDVSSKRIIKVMRILSL